MYILFLPHSPLANYGHITISGIVAMLVAHGRSEHIKMFGDLAFYCIVHNTTPPMYFFSPVGKWVLIILAALFRILGFMSLYYASISG